jgi:hypothetical protein
MDAQLGRYHWPGFLWESWPYEFFVLFMLGIAHGMQQIAEAG